MGGMWGCLGRIVVVFWKVFRGVEIKGNIKKTRINTTKYLYEYSHCFNRSLGLWVNSGPPHETYKKHIKTYINV